MLSSRTPSFLMAAFAMIPVAHATSVVAINQPVPSLLLGATLVGPMDSSKVLNGSMGLLPSNRSALKAYAAAVNDPKSPAYHYFLSPKQVGARFGASAGTVSTAVAYLKSKGLTVTLSCDSQMTILFRGKVSAFESAFGTKLNNYRVAARATPGPLSFYSNAVPPKLPTTFASKVVVIGNLDNANPPVPMATALTPSQSRGLYKGDGLFAGGDRGEGVTVAITNLGDGYRLSNVSLFYQAFNLPAPAGGVGSNITKVKVGTTDGETATEGGETNLDIQSVLAEAPRCKVLVYDGFDADALAVISREYNDDLADILSESWGLGADDAYLESLADVHASMVVSGMTYLAASGDSGTNEGGLYYPHGDPNVIAVGGTDATVSDANGTRVSEVGWSGSGGGYNPSTSLSFNSRPDWQVGNGLPPLTGYNHRLYPDVALQACPPGVQVFVGGKLQGIGGTSAASPQFAGLLALMLNDLKSQSAVDPVTGSAGTHYRLGQLNPFIYGLNGDASAFYDITSGDTGPLPNGVEAVAGTGWDFVTGWGAPIISGLDAALLANSTVSLTDAPSAPAIFTTIGPALTLGKSPSGDASTVMTSGDSLTYTLQSVSQSGVGQVAAATIDIALQTQKARRAVSYGATISVPKQVTGYVYLKNYTTSTSTKPAYDLFQTIAGTGAMVSVSGALALDTSGNSPYIDGSGTMRMLVRSLKPSRFGSAPYTLTIDQAIAVERVPRG